MKEFKQFIKEEETVTESTNLREAKWSELDPKLQTAIDAMDAEINKVIKLLPKSAKKVAGKWQSSFDELVMDAF